MLEMCNGTIVLKDNLAVLLNAVPFKSHSVFLQKYRTILKFTEDFKGPLIAKNRLEKEQS
jgi:hypothetical protein